MKLKKQNTILGFLAAVCVGLGIFSSVMKPAFTPVIQHEKPVFPDLPKLAAQIAVISVHSSEEQLTFKKTESGWALSEKDGYAVSVESLRTFLVGLSQLRFYEEKTSLPERYALLQVEDISKPNSRSKEVALMDIEGKVLANVLIGKEGPSLGKFEPTLYLRVPGEEKSWLAKGAVAMEESLTDWLKSEIIDLESETVKSVYVTLSEGEKLVMSRDARGEMLIQDIPEGSAEKSFEKDDVLRVLKSLELKDVAAKSNFSGWNPITHAEYILRDQSVLKLGYMPKEEKHYVHLAFTVSRNPDVNITLPESVENWIFEVPSYKVDVLGKSRIDFFQN